MRFTKKPQEEPIPGYRLLEPMGCGGFGEVWKCEAPGGLHKAIKFVYGNLNSVGAGRAPAQEELKAIERVKAIRHPFLLSMERVESVTGELIIVMELADKNLQDRLRECTESGLAGLPREELIGYMTEAAEALDLMNLQHNLQHLDIKPHNLFLVYNHVKVGDFGLVHGMSGPAGAQADSLSVTPLYGSPETFLGKVSPQSDQYSLAIVYQELLTRTLPFNGKNARQLLLLHTNGEPDLAALPEWDRPAVAKALAKDPKARFPTCGHFVRALVSGWIPNQLVTLAGLEPPRLMPTPPATRVQAVTPAKEVSSVPGEVIPRPTCTRPKTDLTSLRTTPPRATPLTMMVRPRPTRRADYTLVKRLSVSPVREVWEAHTEGGDVHQVTQIFGWTKRGAALEQAVAGLRGLCHANLVEATVLHCEPGQLVLASDPMPGSLQERLRSCQTEGLPGIPRDELLEHLATAAAVLDEMRETQQVIHLGLSPRHLWWEEGHLRVAELGLVQLFWQPDMEMRFCVPARTTAPEVLAGNPASSSDQYTLALLFGELLTGVLPRRTTKQATLDLAAFSPTDQRCLARALDLDPEQRWPSLTAFVDALAEATPAVSSRPKSLPRADAAARALHGAFNANLPEEAVEPRLEAFRQQWNARLLRRTATRCVFHVTMLGNLWQQTGEQEPGLEVDVELQRSVSVPHAPVEVSVHLRPVGCGQEQGVKFLQDIGNVLYESLQAHLHSVPQRRAEERLPWHYALQVHTLRGEGELSEPLECQGKDISLNGIGFYVPVELPPGQVTLVLPQTPQTPRVTALANIVRVKPCGAGWFEAGAVLLTPAPREAKTTALAGTLG